MSVFQVTPPTIDEPIFFEDFTLTILTVPIRGTKKLENPNYELVTAPNTIPSYAMMNIQNFYKTEDDPKSVVPLFINFPEITTSPFDTYFVIDSAIMKRLDLISYKFYGNVEYWWVIMLVNNILNPFTDLPIGTTLRIPSLDTLYANWLSPIPQRIPG